jgi:hypothetical protein
MSRLFAALAVSFLLSPFSWSTLWSVLSSAQDDERPEAPASSTSDSGASVDPWGGPKG